MIPNISIITVTLNSERYLEQTITSVAEQTYNNIEYIIIDGGSTDSTLDIIKKYNSKIDHWISEPDNGIADAMNKGLSLVTGDYILFIHSDDYLINSKVLEQAAVYLENDIDIFFFKVILEDQGIKKISKNESLNRWTNFKMGSCHQGQLCSINLFNTIGRFDPLYNISMDYDIILRAYRRGVTFKTVKMPISVMRLTGISSQQTWKDLRKRLQEERSIHYKHCKSWRMSILYHLYWPPYLWYRKVRSTFLPN